MDSDEVELLLGLLEQQQQQQQQKLVQGQGQGQGGVYLYDRSIYLLLSHELLEDLAALVRERGRAEAAEIESCLRTRAQGLGLL